MIWRRGIVTHSGKTWSGCVECIVRLDDGLEHKALAYTPQVGQPQCGDEVLLSADAVVKNLGTGGYMFIIAIPGRLPLDPPPVPGHLVKARYTPMQYMVEGVDEQDSEYHTILEDADSIEDMPVVAADLHSALPAIVLAIKAHAPRSRIAYVMTDGGSLPAWFSQTAATLEKESLILGTISCGQAYGGSLEAVNIYTALLAAKHVWNADIAVVTQGPGNLGTGTKWGFSGTQVAEVLHAAHILHGQSIAALRASNADRRSRHFGISHHTMRVLTDIVSKPCTVPVPDLNGNDELLTTLDGEFIQTFNADLASLEACTHLSIETLSASGLGSILAKSPVKLSTMGRSLIQDAASFICAGVAGLYAADVIVSQ